MCFLSQAQNCIIKKVTAKKLGAERDQKNMDESC